MNIIQKGKRLTQRSKNTLTISTVLGKSISRILEAFPLPRGIYPRDLIIRSQITLYINFLDPCQVLLRHPIGLVAFLSSYFENLDGLIQPQAYRVFGTLTLTSKISAQLLIFSPLIQALFCHLLCFPSTVLVRVAPQLYLIQLCGKGWPIGTLIGAGFFGGHGLGFRNCIVRN